MTEDANRESSDRCQMFFNPVHKTVILSEAPRRSIAYQRVYSAESKDPGDACWQMLFGAFRPQAIGKSKKVTSSERSEGSAVSFHPSDTFRLWSPVRPLSGSSNNRS